MGKPEDIIPKLIHGLGVMAEMTTMYYKACLCAGASEEEAARVTGIFMEVMLNQIKNGNMPSGGDE